MAYQKVKRHARCLGLVLIGFSIPGVWDTGMSLPACLAVAVLLGIVFYLLYRGGEWEDETDL